MVIDVLNCELLKAGGRHYRVVGGASVGGTSHARVHVDPYQPTVPHVAGDDEEYDEDDVSAFDVQEGGSDFVIKLAYDAEVHPVSLNIPITHPESSPSVLSERCSIWFSCPVAAATADFTSPRRSEGQN